MPNAKAHWKRRHFDVHVGVGRAHRQLIGHPDRQLRFDALDPRRAGSVAGLFRVEVESRARRIDVDIVEVRLRAGTVHDETRHVQTDAAIE